MIIKPKTGFRIAIVLAFLVLICNIPIVSAEEKTVISNNSVMNTSDADYSTISPLSNLSLTSDEIAKQRFESRNSYDTYYKNLTYGQKKLQSQILQLTDPNYPQSGITQYDIRIQMIQVEKNLIPKDQAVAKFGINNSTGDLILVDIDINSNFTSNNIDPFIANLISRTDNRIVAWIDVNNIEKIALLYNIQFLTLHQLPLFHSNNTESLSPDHFNNLNNSATTGGDGFQNTPTLINLVTTVVPTTINPVSTTHAAPVSLMSIYAAISSGGMIVMLRRIKKSMR